MMGAAALHLYSTPTHAFMRRVSLHCLNRKLYLSLESMLALLRGTGAAQDPR